MSDVKWIKIVTDIFDDEKIMLIEQMPDGDSLIVIWFKLLCLAGKQNNSGVFLINGRIPYTDEMFAAIFRRPLNTVRLALQTFENFGMIEIINDTVTIPKWEKHQKLDVLEAGREAARKRVAKFREKQKLLTEGETGCNVTGNVTTSVTVTPCNADRIDKNIDKDNIPPIIPQGFDEFWKAYPRKVSKATAERAWKKLQVTDSILDTILKDLQRRADGEWKNKELQFIPHPSTYLNQRRWEDESDSEPISEDNAWTITNDISDERLFGTGGS